jgi:putative DNA primase/helicase
MERPEERKFDNLDPHKRVLADRGQYIAAAITIIRAYQAAGAPERECKRVSGFERWSTLVQQALIWLGMDDPLGGMEALRAQDPVQEEVTKLLAVLRETFPKPEQYRAITVAKCVELANKDTAKDQYGRPTAYLYPKLRELMLDEYGKINERSFGKKLTDGRDQIRDEWCIRLREKKVDGRNAYFLAGPTPDSVAWEGAAGATAPTAGGAAAAAATDEEIPF